MLPEIDWETVWKRVRFPPLSSGTMTFLFKLMHHLLPTEERISNTLGTMPSSCRTGCPDNVEANLEHCFISCNSVREVSSWLVDTVHIFFPLANPASLLNLNLPDNDALLWIVANTLQFIWRERSARKKATLVSCLAHLRSEALTMKEAFHRQLADRILEIIEYQV